MHSKVVNAYPKNTKDGKVLLLIWQDPNKVGFCSTIHDGTEWTVQNRKRLKALLTLALITKQPFAMFDLLNECKDLYVYT